MPQTYTSAWQFVQDGEATSADPQALVATDSPITVLNAEIQWEGSETSETTTTTDYSTNTNTATAEATTSTTTDTYTDTNTRTFDIVSDGNTYTISFDSPTGDTVQRYETKLEAKYDADGGIYPFDATCNGTSFEESLTADGSWQTIFDVQSGTDGSGDSTTVDIDRIGTTGDGTTIDAIRITSRVISETTSTSTNSDTSCASYPSVPSGYTFDRHYWREEQNGTKVDSGFVYTNSVGDSRCVTSTDPSNTWTLEVETRGEDETTTTTYYDTHDPSVSGDVSGSYTGTLADGETSTWEALSGLTAGTSNTFEHSIQESHEASFRFRFEWEQVAADPTYGTVGFYDDDAGVYRECAVAEPTDTALEYDHVAIYNDAQGAWGVLDLVDPSDDAAITSHQFYDPDVGWLAPREYSTTTP